MRPLRQPLSAHPLPTSPRPAGSGPRPSAPRRGRGRPASPPRPNVGPTAAPRVAPPGAGSGGREPAGSPPSPPPPARPTSANSRRRQSTSGRRPRGLDKPAGPNRRHRTPAPSGSAATTRRCVPSERHKVRCLIYLLRRLCRQQAAFPVFTAASVSLMVSRVTRIMD